VALEILYIKVLFTVYGVFHQDSGSGKFVYKGLDIHRVGREDSHFELTHGVFEITGVVREVPGADKKQSGGHGQFDYSGVTPEVGLYGSDARHQRGYSFGRVSRFGLK
jgi:hypothetical protein